MSREHDQSVHLAGGVAGVEQERPRDQGASLSATIVTGSP
jgi:hypothetical protein